MIVYFYQVKYVFQSESTLCSCLNVKELLDPNKRDIWSLSDCSGTQTRCLHLLRMMMMMNYFCGMVDQRRTLSEILIIANIRHAAIMIWTCAEPEFSLCWIKLCTRDNQHHRSHLVQMLYLCVHYGRNIKHDRNGRNIKFYQTLIIALLYWCLQVLSPLLKLKIYIKEELDSCLTITKFLQKNIGKIR